MNIQSLTLLEVQPSQLYISEAKLIRVNAWLKPSDLGNFQPIPKKILDGIPVMTDGHTRAAAALRYGLTAVPLVEEDEDLDWEMYRRCVQACRERKIFSPMDLLHRIINEKEYRKRWYSWCDKMQAEVLAEKKSELFYSACPEFQKKAGWGISFQGIYF